MTPGVSGSFDSRPATPEARRPLYTLARWNASKCRPAPASLAVLRAESPCRSPIHSTRSPTRNESLMAVGARRVTRTLNRQSHPRRLRAPAPLARRAASKRPRGGIPTRRSGGECRPRCGPRRRPRGPYGDRNRAVTCACTGADDGTRTRDPHLGKAVVAILMHSGSSSLVRFGVSAGQRHHAGCGRPTRDGSGRTDCHPNCHLTLTASRAPPGARLASRVGLSPGSGTSRSIQTRGRG